MIEIEIRERITRLETQQQETAKDVSEIKEGQQKMLLELTRYKGAFGLLMLLGSIFLAAAGLAKDWIVTKVGG